MTPNVRRGQAETVSERTAGQESRRSHSEHVRGTRNPLAVDHESHALLNGRPTTHGCAIRCRAPQRTTPLPQFETRASQDQLRECPNPPRVACGVANANPATRRLTDSQLSFVPQAGVSPESGGSTTRGPHAHAQARDVHSLSIADILATQGGKLGRPRTESVAVCQSPFKWVTGMGTSWWVHEQHVQSTPRPSHIYKGPGALAQPFIRRYTTSPVATSLKTRKVGSFNQKLL